MQSNELPDEKAALEEKIRLSVTRLIKDFEHRSGIGISGISISFIDVSTLSSPRPAMAIGGVEVHLSL